MDVILTTTAARDDGRADQTQGARDRRLTTMLSDEALAWVLEERFDTTLNIWAVTLLRADPWAGWREQRYRYDAAADTVYFWGERPVPVEEVRVLPLHAVPRLPPGRTSRT